MWPICSWMNCEFSWFYSWKFHLSNLLCHGPIKHSTLIIYYYLPLALLSFIGANESMMPPIYLLFISSWLCFHSYSWMKALHSYLLLSLFPNPVSVNRSNPLWFIYYFLLLLFLFVLANKSTPLLLLFTFGSAFVRKCEWKHEMLPIFIYFLFALFSFILANKSTPLLLLFTFGSAFVRKCEQKQSTLIINYFLLVLFLFVLVNESTPLLFIIYFWLCFHS